jgi:hypothetical protein
VGLWCYDGLLKGEDEGPKSFCHSHYHVMHPVLRRQYLLRKLNVGYGQNAATKIWVELGPSVASLFNVLTFAN